MFDIKACDINEYEDSNFNKNYLEFLKTIPNGNKYIRTWEYSYVIENGDFSLDHSVLDVGSLFTVFPAYVARFVRDICLTDSLAWSETSQQKTMEVDEWRRLVAGLGNNISVRDADVISLPFMDGVFDRVICVSTIEHVEDDRNGMEEMVRVLKPGGKLILTTEYHPTRYLKWNGTQSFRLYTPEALEKLIKNLGEVSNLKATNVVERFPGWYFGMVALVLTNP